MLVRRALLALMLGCLVGGTVPAVANAADDPGAIIASLGSKALAEIQKNNASRPLMEANFIESSPVPCKFVMKELGLCEENLRLPLVPVSAETRSKLRAAMSGICG